METALKARNFTPGLEPRVDRRRPPRRVRAQLPLSGLAPEHEAAPLRGVMIGLAVSAVLWTPIAAIAYFVV